jgi:hypothetical protein
LRNLEDLLVIAVEILNETKWYEPSVLNPINFIQLSFLEFGLSKNPQNKTFIAWQIKIYAKLGLCSLVTDLSQRIAKPE